MLPCTTIPHVKNNRGGTVPSELYSTLMEFTTDHSLLNKIYVSTKTDSFKEWLPVLDWNDEPIISYIDGQPVFLSHKGEVVHIFPKGTMYRMMKSSDVFDHLKKLNLVDDYNNLKSETLNSLEEQNYAGKMNPLTQKAYYKVSELNNTYKKLYNLRDDLAYVKKIGSKYKLFVNPNSVEKINKIRQDRMNNHLLPNIEEDLNDIRKKKASSLILSAKRFLEYKKRTLDILEEKRKIIKNKLRAEKGKSMTEETEKLISRLQRINELLNGNVYDKGLKEEISDLTNVIESQGTNINMSDLHEFAFSSLNRMDEITSSDNLEDIQEASEIASFFRSAGALIPENPILTPVEQTLLSEDDKKTLENWRSRAEAKSMILASKKRDNVLNIVSSAPGIRAMYNGKLTEERISELMGEKGLKDINPIDMLFMDATNGIFSHNGILPQVARIELENSMNRSKSVVKRFETRLNKLLPEAEKYLSDINGGRHKYKIGKAVSWDMFFQKTKEGFKTGRLISRYSDAWNMAYSKMERDYRDKLHSISNDAVILDTFGENIFRMKRDLKEERKKWFERNTDMINFMGIEEIVNFIKEHPVLSEMNFPVKEKFLEAKDLGITDKHFKEIIENQIELLNDYANNWKIQRDKYIEEEGELTDKNKQKLRYWEMEHSPYYGFLQNEKDSHSNEVIENGKVTFKIHNNYQFNTYIPKKTIGKETTGYWESDFDFVENSDALYEMRNLMEEVFDYVNDTMPVSDGSINTIRKNIYEIMFDNSDSSLATRLHEAWIYLVDKLKEAISIVEGSTTKKIDTDASGNELEKVNNKIVAANKSDISNRFAVEKMKFLSVTKNAADVNFYTSLDQAYLSADSIALLASYLGVSHNLEAIKEKLGIKDRNIPVGKIIRNYVTNEVVNDSSMNLPRTMLSYLYVAAEYNARNEVKPIIDSILEKYESIKNIKTNNVAMPYVKSDKYVYNGDRNYAKKQFNDWYKRAVLGHYESKHFGAIGNEKVYSDYEKQLKADIEVELSKLAGNTDDLSIHHKKELENVLNNIGRQVYASKAITGIMNMIRLKALGWNLSSGIGNLLEGQISNEITAASGDYFSSNNWYRAAGIVHELMVNKKGKNAKLVEELMNRYDVLFDSKNEFQKQMTKTPLSKLERFGAYELNASIEYLNQSPLMIAMIMEQKVKDENGENEISLWDAFDEEGKLKEGYRTETNINNWENLSGEDYEVFKHKLVKVNVNTHGDYDPLRGIMAKSSLLGKGFMAFKTWLPRAMYTRFATEQDDIELGIKGYKGRYRSHTSVSAGLHGAIVGFGIADGMGAVAGYGTGLLLGTINKANHSFAGINNVNNPLTAHLEELGVYAKIMGKRLFGIPINRITKAETIKVADGTSILQDYGFSERDAKNMQSNLIEIALTASFIALTLLVKAALYEDDDEDPVRRQLHNLLVNRLMTLTSQASMYVNLPDMKESVTNVAFFKFTEDVIKIGKDVQKFVENDDIIKTGENKGKSRLLKDSKKAFLPYIAQLDPTLGLSKQADRQFVASPYDKWFWSSEHKSSDVRKKERAALRTELVSSGYSVKAANKIVDKKLPTIKWKNKDEDE